MSLLQKEISRAVMQELKKGNEVSTTTQLRRIIEKALCRVPEKEREEAVKKSCQRTFQALRIDVNSEFEVLEAFLEKLPDVLAEGGRAAILTFHSGEDRLVKKILQAALQSRCIQGSIHRSHTAVRRRVQKKSPGRQQKCAGRSKHNSFLQHGCHNSFYPLTG